MKRLGFSFRQAKQFALVTLLCAFFTFSAKASLNGTYTINGGAAASSTNYKTFASAVSDLLSGTRSDGGTANGSGVGGAVVFNVANGIYAEQISISAVTGVSASKTITFQSTLGDSSKATLSWPTNTGSNYAVQLNGAQYICFRKLGIARNGTGTSSRVFEYVNSANSNLVSNCLLQGGRNNTTSTASAIVYSNTGADTGNVFTYNNMRNGGYGFYWFGPSATSESGTVISGNVLDSIYYMGMRLEYQDRIVVSANKINNPRYVNAYGIYMNNNFGASRVTKNIINMSTGGQSGLYMSYCSGTTSLRWLVANNMISVGGTGTSLNAGFFSNYCSYNDIYHNSILITNDYTSGYGFYYYSFNATNTSNIKNNCAVNTGGGYVTYVYYYDVNQMDYNNWYSSSAQFGYWNGTPYANLSAWKTASGLDANAKSVNPYYLSTSDLHVGNPALNAAGVGLTLVKDDIDGQARNTSTPDIGADEFTPPSADAGITKIVSPTGGYCAGSKTVTINITNFGLNALTSAKINWTVNGVAQTVFTYGGSLASGNVASVNIGSYTFAAATTYAIKAWTTLPNGSADPNNLNDTSAIANLKEGLNGTYTIGGASPNYATFTAAAADLNANGVCGPVVFNVRDGSYNEYFTLNNIPNTSATNTVTFQSQSGDSSKVTLYQSSSSSFNYIVLLNGANYVTFKKLSLQRTGSPSNSYGRMFEFKSGASNNSILNCQLLGLKSTYYYMSHELIYSSQDIDSNNLFQSNLMRNGTYGFYFFGTSNTIKERSNRVINNIIDSTMGYGNYFYYQDAMTIKGNKIVNLNTGSSGSWVAYGLNLYYCDNIKQIYKNSIYIAGAYQQNFGMYMYYCSAATSCIVSNNMISVAGIPQSSTYGLYSYQSVNTHFYFNNISIPDASSQSYGCYHYVTSGTNNFVNNIVVNNGGGLAIQVNNSGNINTMNYNCYKTSGSWLGTWVGTPCAVLSDWQTASSKDANSISVDPFYYSKSDLHVSNAAINAKATTITGITEDIDGQARPATPDIGADEFTPPSVDAGITKINSPNNGYCAGTKSVMVTITNFGLTTLTSAKIYWSVNGVAQSIFSYAGTPLVSGAAITFPVGSYAFATGNTYNIKVWSTLPNGLTDPNNGNDTSIATNLKEGLSGTYTIGGASPDYATVVSAVLDLTTKGLCGPVVFNMRDGSYNEYFTISDVPGSSSVNTVTFQSQSGDSSKVTIYQNSSTSYNYVVTLNGANYITFKKITFQRTGSVTNSYGRLMEFKGGACNNSVLNCQLIGLKSIYYYYSHELVYSNQDNDTNNLFQNNMMHNGTHGFYFFGSSSTYKEGGNRFINNIIDSTMGYGNYFYYQDRMTIRGNKIVNLSTGSVGSWQAFGLIINACDNIKQIYKNTIYVAGAYQQNYGIYLNTCPNVGLFANNMVTVAGVPQGSSYGIYSNQNPGTNFYFNTIHIPDASYQSYGMYINLGSGSSNFVNNIVSNVGGGVAMQVSSGTYIGTMNYNCYRTTGTILGNWAGTPCVLLSDWVTASTKDANSISVNPYFNSSADLHISNAALNGKATSISGITEDIDGQVRPGSTDIGADEFTPPALDAGVIAINQPNGGYCAGTKPVLVTINNFGTTSLTSVKVNWSINGTGQTTYNWAGTLASGASVQVSIGSFTFVASSIYTIKTWTSNPNSSVDGNIKNDSANTYNMAQSLAGTYTIGGTTPDYGSFTAAVADLNLKGVCGPVVFNVRDGSYNEQVSIGSILGASAINTVTFQSQSLDSSKVKMWIASGVSSPLNYVVQLNGANFVTFRKLTLSRRGTSTWGTVVDVKKNASSNRFLNNIFIGTTSLSTTTSNAIVYSTTDNDTGNIFRNNYIVQGSYGFYYFGNSNTSQEKGTIIEGNTFDSNYYYAMQLYYQDGITIRGNTVKNQIYKDYTYGIYLYYVSNAVNISKNKIYLPNGGYGIYSYMMLGTSANPINISNNFITVNGGTSTNYCVYLQYTHYMNFYNNNLLITNNIINGTRPAYLYGYSSSYYFANIFNNNFVNMSGGPAIEIPNGSHVNTMDNNNYYPYKGKIFGYWNGTPYADLAAWKTATGKDVSAQSVNPYYAGTYDLHVSNVNLNAKAKPMASIVDDIDGQARAATPDVGADEFKPFILDAGIAAIDSPTGGYCKGAHPVMVSLVNFGNTTLTSTKIDWAVNGVSQTPFNWTGSLTSGNAVQVNVGSYTFITASTYNLKAWTSLPNGGLDSNSINDTSSVLNLFEGLQGTYTIGGGAPDYATFTLAANALNMQGVCGPVVFNVRDGSYNEQFVLKAINNASSVNTITFQSQSLDSSKVRVWFNSGTGSTTNYVAGMDGTNWVTFKNLGFERTGANIFGTIFELKGGASNNNFFNNLIQGPRYITTTNWNALVNSPQDLDTANVFRNNNMRNGAYGFYFYGKTTTPYAGGNVVDGNILDSMYYMGIQYYYQDRLIIKNNIIRDLAYTSSATNVFGIYLNICQNGLIVNKNQIYSPQDAYGIYMSSCGGTAARPTFVTNNMVSIVGTNQSQTYGMYTNSCAYTNYYHNTIYINSSMMSSYGFYHSSGTNSMVLGNSFHSKGGSMAIYINTLTNLIRLNYNNYFVENGTYLGYVSGNRKDLAAWKTAAPKDTNSISVNPYYHGTYNLHVFNPLLDAAAKKLGYLKDDIDNEARAATPDIGADEFNPTPADAGIYKLDNPDGNYCTGPMDVICTLVNYGTTSLTSATINWTLNGTAQTAFAWTGSLSPGASQQVTIATSYSFTGGSVYDIKVYTTNPNGGTDGDHRNDSTIVLKLYEGLKGTYTIGGTTPDYANFTAAVADLNLRGLCDHVVFNVRNGVYKEQVSIKQYAQAAKYTATFQSQSGDSSLVNLSFPSSGSSNIANYTVQLNGADNVIFKRLTISRTGNSYYGRTIEIKAGAHRNRFLNNQIAGSKTTQYYYPAEDIYSGNDRDTSNWIINNLIKNGTYGVYMYGNTSAGQNEKGSLVINNTIDSCYTGGVYFYYQDSVYIYGNKINSYTYNQFYGIYVYNCQNGLWIQKNQIYMPSGGYGVFLQTINNTAAIPGWFTNNMVSVAGTGGYAYGIYTSSGNYLNVYYNSFLVNSTVSGARAAYFSSISNTKLLNNNFINYNAGVAMEVSGSMTYITRSNYNNFYSVSGILNVGVGISAGVDLASWKTASGKDTNSISALPFFKSAKNLHASSTLIDSKAKSLNNVSDDIDGEARDASTPDIGADEFKIVLTKDAAIINAILVGGGGCASNTATMAVVVLNNGTSSISNIPVTATTSTGVTLSDTLKKTLAPGKFDTLYFKTAFSTFPGGNILPKAYTILAGDMEPANDTLYPITPFRVRKPAKGPTGLAAARCGSGTLILASKPSNMGMTNYWYDSSAAGKLLATGDTFKTPILKTSTYYYVESGGLGFDTLGTNFVGNLTGRNGVMFDVTAKNAITIDSFDINVNGTTGDDFEVYYRKGGYTGFEFSAGSWTKLGSQYIVPKGQGLPSRIYVGKLPIAAGQTYGIYIRGKSYNNLVLGTQSNFVSGFDMDINSGKFLNNLFNSVSGASYNWNGRIYYEYAGCPTARTKVLAKITHGVSGATVQQGITYGGIFKTGTATDPDIVCPGNTVSYEMTPPTGYTNAGWNTTWKIKALNVSTAKGHISNDTSTIKPTAFTNLLINFTPKSADGDSLYLINYTLEDSSIGCDTIFERYVYVSADKVSFSNPGGCLGSSVTFSSTKGISRFGNPKIKWDFGDGGTDTVMNPTHTYASSGSFTVKLKVANPGGCGDSFSQSIITYDPPKAKISFGPTCAGDSVNFADSSTIAGGVANIVSRAWSFGDAGTSAKTNPAHLYAATTSYTASLVVTSNKGCKDSTSKTLTIRTKPGYGIVTANICSGDSAYFKDTATVGGPMTAWDWKFGDGGTSTIAKPAHKYTAIGIYKAKLAITNVSGCTTNDSALILVNSIPSGGAGAAKTICATQSTTIGNTAVAGHTYNWTSSPAGFSSATANPSVSPTVTTTYYLTEAITATGCSKTDSVLVTVNPLPLVNSGPDTSICAGSSRVMGIAAITGHTYSWSSSPAGYTSTVAKPTVTPSATTSYYLTESITATGCSLADTSTITIISKPTVTAGSDQPICMGSNASLGGSAVAGHVYSWTSTPAGFTSTSSNVSVSPTVNTTYYLNETVSASGCTNTDTVKVTVNALPVPFAGADKTICEGSSAGIGKAATAGRTYSWISSPSGYTSTASNPTVSPIVTTAYYITETITATTCAQTDTVIITVNPAPAKNAGSDVAICIGQTTNIGATATSGNTYSWTSAPAGFTSTASTASVKPLVTTNYYLKETVTATGCFTRDTILVTVNPLPTVSKGSNTKVCATSSVTLGATAVTGHDYLWTSNPSGFTSTVSNPNVTPAANTWYYLTETITATGCSKTDSLLMTVNPLPAPKAGLDTTTCAGQLAIRGMKTVAGHTYSWSSNPVGYTSAAATVNLKPLVTTTYYMKETVTATGCNTTDTLDITVNPLPSPVAGSDASICKGSSTTLGTSATTGRTYSWTSTPVGYLNTNSNPSVNPSATTTYYLTEAITATGCTNRDTVKVTVNPIPAPVAGKDVAICYGKSATIGTATSIAGHTYAWTSNPSGFTSTVTNPSVSPTANTTYYVTETISSSTCSNTDTVVVTVNPLPTVSAGTTSTICAKQSTSIGSTAVTGQTYLWTGKPTAYSSTAAMPTVSPTADNWYYRSITITATGCKNIDSAQVIVKPLPLTKAGKDTTVCSGTPIKRGMTAVSGNTYSWSSVPTGYSGSTSSITLSPTANAKYYLTESITATGCSKTDSFSVTVKSLPVVSAGADKNICMVKGTITLTSGTPTKGNWKGTGITDSTKGLFSPSTATVGYHKLYYYYKDPVSLCSNRDTVQLAVKAVPVSAFTSSTLGCKKDSTAFLNTSSLDSSSYWMFGDAGTDVRKSPNHSYADTGFYTVKLISSTAYGCMDTATKTIRMNSIPQLKYFMPDSICSGTSVSFINGSFGYNARYAWDFGNGDSSNINSPKETFKSITGDTTYRVRLRSWNYCGMDTLDKNILVKMKPTASFAISAVSACNSVAITFTNNTKGRIDKYFWDFGNGKTSTLKNPGVMAYNSDTTDKVYVVKLTVTNQCDTNSMTRTVTMYANKLHTGMRPDKRVGYLPMKVTFADFTVKRLNKKVTYDYGDGNTGSSNIYTYNTTGTFLVKQIVTNGCVTDTAYVFIRVLPVPVPAWTTSSPVCFNSPVKFHNLTKDTITSSWDLGDGSFSALDSPTHTFPKPGTYTVVLTVTTLYGYKASFSAPVLVNALPNVSMTPDTMRICVQRPFTFNKTEGPGETFNWAFGDGGTATGSRPVHQYNTVGTFSYSLQAKNAAGCSNAAVYTVVTKPVPVAGFVLTSSASCILPAKSQAFDRSTSAVKYAWDFGNGQTATDSSPSITYTKSGLYKVRQTVVNSFGCADTASRLYNAFQMPKPDFIVEKDNLCDSVPARFFNKTGVDSLKYTWMFGDGDTLVKKDSPVHIYAKPGKYNVSLMVNNSTGCSSIATKRNIITIHGIPSAKFTWAPITEPSYKGVVGFEPDTFGPFKSRWEFGDTSHDYVNHAPKHPYRHNADYIVSHITISDFGCRDTFIDTVKLNWTASIFAPNIMLPTSAHEECNVFIPKGMGIMAYEVEVYSRWGELVWRSDKIVNGSPAEVWDGNMKGKSVPTDVYIWFIKGVFQDGRPFERRGSIHLVK